MHFTFKPAGTKCLQVFYFLHKILPTILKNEDAGKTTEELTCSHAGLFT
jgi:hypothetical protein